MEYLFKEYMATLYAWPLVLSVPTPPAPPFIIQISAPPPTWTYFIPLAAALTVVVGALIAYVGTLRAATIAFSAAKEQSRGAIEATQLQLDAEKEARERAEEVETERQKAREERHYAAVRVQLCKMLERAAHAIITEGEAPGKDDVYNDILLQRFRRVSDRAYDLEIIEALNQEQADKLLHAVSMNEALLTFLLPLWKDDNPSAADVKRVRLKCASAIRNIADALVAFEASGTYYEKEADRIGKLA